jgi:enoyl-CoA hydratase
MTGYEDLHFLEVRIEAGVAVVVLDGPEEGNAISFEGHGEMSAILPRLGRDERVDAVLLTGAGDSFCVGPTAAFMERISANDPQVVPALMADVRALVQGHVECEKPVVAALNGPAGGGPLAFALLADVVIAERHVTLSDMHVAAAVAAGDGGVLIWPLAMGLLRAKRYLLTGDPLAADEAQRLGLVTEVVEPGASFERAMVFARRFASGPRQALRHTKRALNQWLRLGMPAFDLSWAGEILTVATPEARAGWQGLVRGEPLLPPDSARAVAPDPRRGGNG